MMFKKVNLQVINWINDEHESDLLLFNSIPIFTIKRRTNAFDVISLCVFVVNIVVVILLLPQFKSQHMTIDTTADMQQNW